MGRINTNVTSLVAQRVLRNNNDKLNTSLERLSTGLKINRGADNPAGLLVSENLRAEKAGITQAIDNASRASNIIGIAEGGLNEVSSLLTQLQGLVNQAANTGGMSTEEIQANQMQVDSILSTINRIAGATNFQGNKLLNGNYDYTTSSVGTSAVAALQVNSARVVDGSTMSVTVQVVASAQTGTLTYSGGTIAGSTATIEVAGNLGTEQISFASGTTVSSMATAVNAIKNSTGVSATVNGSNLVFNSTSYGSSQFVGVRAINGTFTMATSKDFGRNATVTINGASTVTDGLHISYRTADLDVDFDLTSSANTDGTSKTFGITGGGATFALGSKVLETNKACIGITSIATTSLGATDDGTTMHYLNSLGTGSANSLSSENLTRSQRILDKAIKQVSQLRGRLGAFQKFTVGSTINSLGIAYENVSAAESAIRDTDFAEETATMTRSQILSQAATTVLAQANSAPQSALSLLR